VGWDRISDSARADQGTELGVKFGGVPILGENVIDFGAYGSSFKNSSYPL
jgi:hypothetical protein